jgi:hypothetical protein
MPLPRAAQVIRLYIHPILIPCRYRGPRRLSAFTSIYIINSVPLPRAAQIIRLSLLRYIDSMLLPRPKQVPFVSLIMQVPRSIGSYLCSESLQARSKYRLRCTQTNISKEKRTFSPTIYVYTCHCFRRTLSPLATCDAHCHETFTLYGPCEPVPKYFSIKIFFNF